MYNQPSRVRYAYGGVRVSSKEQGPKDSPQAQMSGFLRYVFGVVLAAAPFPSNAENEVVVPLDQLGECMPVA